MASEVISFALLCAPCRAPEDNYRVCLPHGHCGPDTLEYEAPLANPHGVMPCVPRSHVGLKAPSSCALHNPSLRHGVNLDGVESYQRYTPHTPSSHPPTHAQKEALVSTECYAPEDNYRVCLPHGHCGPDTLEYEAPLANPHGVMPCVPRSHVGLKAPSSCALHNPSLRHGVNLDGIESYQRYTPLTLSRTTNSKVALFLFTSLVDHLRLLIADAVTRCDGR